MSSQPDYVRKKLGPLRDKALRNAVAHPIAKEFPRIGGPPICRLCADMILAVVFKHMRPREHVAHGQALSMAVSVDDLPEHRQRIVDTDLVPVLLDLSAEEDVELRIEAVRGKVRERVGPYLGPHAGSPRAPALVARPREAQLVSEIRPETL